MQPGVTIVIAAYNAEATIARAVRSALAEPEAAEVVVVDDASQDASVAAARAADDGSGRLKVLTQPQNTGPSAARNRALAESRAEWVGVLDADDFFLPGRLRGLLAHAAEADFIADDMWQVPEHDVDGPRTPLLHPPLEKKIAVDFEAFVRSNVTRKGRYRGELGFIKPLMRRSFLDKHGLRYREEMRLGEDFELYARALGLGARMALLPAQGYVSVVRAGSLSGRHTEEDLRNLRDCDAALQRDLPLSPSEKQALKQHYASVDCRLQWRLLILAVKRRSLKDALACFFRPYPVAFYLFKQLAVQCWLRSLGRPKA